MGIDVSPEVRLLDQLAQELAAGGVRAQVRDDLPALAVSTLTPGVFVWVFLSATGHRFACYLGDRLGEFPIDNPQSAASEIANHVRGMTP